MKTLFLCICGLFFSSFISVTKANAYAESYKIETSQPKIPSAEQQKQELLEGKRLVDEVSNSKVWELIQGGDIIGNGTGIVEVRFFESFYSLSSLITRCLESEFCSLSGGDKKLLRSIGEVLKINLQQRYQLLFLSGQEHPNFFLDSEQIGPRTAKTGYRAGTPIFLNRDHFYSNGAPIIQVKDAIAILIHELGHQTGERSHTKLDGLGSRFATWATGKGYFIQTKISDQVAEFSVMNPATPNRWPLAWISLDSRSAKITRIMKESARCKDSSREPTGATLSNLHWRRETVSEKEIRISASAWVTLFCEGQDALIYEEDHSIDIDFTVFPSREKADSLQLNWVSSAMF